MTKQAKETTNRLSWVKKRAFVLTVALAIVVGLLTAVVGWLASTYRDQSATADARVAAAAAGRAGLKDVLSYSYRSVDETVQAARSALTGEFRDQYTELMKKVVAPSAKKKKLVTRTSVAGISVVSASPSEADVLAFVDQTTSEGENAATPRLGSSRVILHLTRIDGRWLIASMKPL